MQRSLDLIERHLSLPSPLQGLHYPSFQSTVWVKRDDLIHPLVCGNKWRKLKYFLVHHPDCWERSWTTFGGPYSNHVTALAQVAHWVGIPLKVYVRGKSFYRNNPVIQDWLAKNVDVVFIQPHTFRSFMQSYTPANNELVFPEGGSSVYSKYGVHEMLQEIESDQPGLLANCDFWLAVGTGGTVSGLSSYSKPMGSIKAVPVVRDPSVPDRVLEYAEDSRHAVDWIPYPLSGKFGHQDPSLLEYIQFQSRKYQIPLEPIYTGKLVYTLESYYRHNPLPESQNVLWLHSGGLANYQDP